MFDNLTTRLNGIFDRLRGFGRLTEENVQEAPPRSADRPSSRPTSTSRSSGPSSSGSASRAVGQDVLKSLTPGQQVVKVVHDELVALLGGSAHRLAMASRIRPTVIMLVGLQGSGKTTTAAKLARLFAEAGPAPDPRLRRRLPAGRHRPAPDARRQPSAFRYWAIPARSRWPSARLRGTRRRQRGLCSAHPGHRRAPAHRRGDARRSSRRSSARWRRITCCWWSTP